MAGEGAPSRSWQLIESVPGLFEQHETQVSLLQKRRALHTNINFLVAESELSCLMVRQSGICRLRMVGSLTIRKICESGLIQCQKKETRTADSIRRRAPR